MTTGTSRLPRPTDVWALIDAAFCACEEKGWHPVPWPRYGAGRLLAPAGLATLIDAMVSQQFSRLQDGTLQLAFGFGDLEELLERPNISERLGLVVNGKRMPPEIYSKRRHNQVVEESVLLPERFRSLVRASCSVVLNRVQELSPEIARVSNELEADFGVPNSVNLYATLGGVPAFDWHTDDHDVIAVQLVGTKRWKLQPASGGDARQRELVVGPGDVLYVPEGLAHCVQPTGKPSLHLSFGYKYANSEGWRPSTWYPIMPLELSGQPNEDFLSAIGLSAMEYSFDSVLAQPWESSWPGVSVVAPLSSHIKRALKGEAPLPIFRRLIGAIQAHTAGGVGRSEMTCIEGSLRRGS